MIAGASSGVGKTTVATGIMATLHRRGLAVQPFKVGPDYIDPSYHLAATGVPSRNIDGWMVRGEALLELFHRACLGSQVAVIEGVMGLFDGASGLDELGSTASIAKLLDAPVVLVMDVRGMARSAAAMALGYARFDPDLRLAGFLLNNVGGETHYRWAKEAIESIGAGPVLGYLPRDPQLVLPERHLGLVPTAERALPDSFLKKLVDLVEAHVDLDRLLAISRQPSAVSRHPDPLPGGEGEVRTAQDSELRTQHSGLRTQDSALFPETPVPARARIAVAMDEVFSFYYQDNLDLLKAHGAELVPFSPLRDPEVPAGADALYLGGGFPEMQAAALAANRSMIESVRKAAEAGMPVYGECGGLMYLSQGIVDPEGIRHPMVGTVPGWCSMLERRLSLAYLEVQSLRDTLLGPAETRARGHEFHWSRWDGMDPSSAAYRLVNKGGRPEGYARGNLLASFVHLHFGANPALAPAFVQSAVGIVP